MTPVTLADNFYDDHGLGPLFPHWQEALPTLISFGIVLYLIGGVLIPRAVRQLEERSEAIEGGIERAEQIQAQAGDQLAEYRAALAEARHDAAKSREEAREQGDRIIAEAREQAQAEAARMIEEAQVQIRADRERAFAQLRPEIGRLSIDLASKVTGENLAEEPATRATVDRFLSEA